MELTDKFDSACCCVSLPFPISSVTHCTGFLPYRGRIIYESGGWQGMFWSQSGNRRWLLYLCVLGWRQRDIQRQRQTERERQRSLLGNIKSQVASHGLPGNLAVDTLTTWKIMSWQDVNDSHTIKGIVLYSLCSAILEMHVNLWSIFLPFNILTVDPFENDYFVVEDQINI